MNFKRPTVLRSPLTLLACALLTLGLLPAEAAVSSQPAQTLREAVEKAVTSNPEVQAAYHRFLSAQEGVKVGRGGYFPRVDLSAGVGREHLDRPDFVADRSYTRKGASLNLNQMLFDGFATRSEVRRLSAEQRLRYFELLTTSEEIALEAVRAYLDVQRFTQLARYAQENLDSHNTIFKQIDERASAGVSRGVDLEQASGRLALAQSNVMTETSNRHDVSARYRRIVGELPYTTLQAMEDLSAKLPSTAELVDSALARAPAMRAAMAGTAAARAGEQRAEASFYPTLDLRARQDLTDNQEGIDGRTKSRAVELIANYNLFNGGSDSARLKQASYETSYAKDVRDKTCRDLGQTISIAHNDLQKLTEQRNFLSQHETSTRKVRDAYRQQFDLGQRSLLDLLDTENELFTARRALANAEADLQLAQARVLAPLGRLLSSFGLDGFTKNAPEMNDADQLDARGCLDASGVSLPIADH